MLGGKEASRTAEEADSISQEEAVAAAVVEEEEAEKEELLTGMRMMMISALILDHLLPTGTEYFHAIRLLLECHFTVVLTYLPRCPLYILKTFI